MKVSYLFSWKSLMLSKVGGTWPESCNLEEIYDLQHYKSWGENRNLCFVGHIKKDYLHEGSKRGEKSCAPRGRTFHLPVSLSCFNEEFTHYEEKYTKKHERIIIVRKSDDKTRIHKEGVGRMSYGLTRWVRVLLYGLLLGGEGDLMIVTIEAIFINTHLKY